MVRAGPPEVKPAYILAELNDLLTAATGDELESLPQPSIDSPYLASSRIEPLPLPVFAVPWQSLRAHLLLESPVPFRRRNIFIDSSIGARV